MNPDPEIWRPISGYEGLYEVSDHGRVRRLDRIDCRGRRRPARLLHGTCDGEGYRIYGLTGRGTRDEPAKTTHLRGHALVLVAFRGPRPAGMEGCHNNGDPADNRLENLRWDTRVANRQDAIRHGTSLTTAGRRRRRLHPTPKPAPGCCKRGHRVTGANATPGRRSRCQACMNAHNIVNAARRRDGTILDVAAVADEEYKRLHLAA